ncbi:MAG: 6-carboxytetrahydropterin synthase [Nitrospira sp.]|nr:6-carboxytetrahydropterin synthase [Nitrospira sp.]
MVRSTLTKRIEFSASHRYSKTDWDAARNYEVFGPCSQEHGHNYLLDVTLSGRVDPVTGMIMNLYDLKQVVTDVLEEFDHKHLNLDTPYFSQFLPTTENLALVLWRKFRARPETRDIASICLCEGDDLWAELRTPEGSSGSPDNAEPVEARVTRRYDLVVHRPTVSSHLETWPLSLDVTVRGPIDPVTGRVMDIATLDDGVTTRVLQHFPATNLSPHPPCDRQPMTLLTVARTLWPPLADVAGERLAQLKLRDRHALTLEYSNVLG